MIALPDAVVKWVASLPEPHRTRELMIAERNWARIIKHISKGGKK
jgi:hypothetical protein